MTKSKRISGRCQVAALAAAALLTSAIMPHTLRAQTTESTTPTDHELVQKLLERVEKQDDEIKALKAHENVTPKPAQADLSAAGGVTSASPAADSAATPTTAPTNPEVLKRLADHDAALKSLQETVATAAAQENQPPAYPTLQFHGFGDIDYHTTNKSQLKNAFTLGEFDVFLSSQLAPDLGVMSETVLSADNTNTYGVEIERLLVQYHPNEFFNVDLGRFHTAVGYYNTAYHHGTWFQTATGRPAIVQFEDSGGIIPVHTVGFSIHGAIPSGPLGLGYFVEVGNGRQYYPPTSNNNPVGNIFDDNGFKAVNIAFTSKPEAIEGLQFGAGLYHDTVTPQNVQETEESIVHAHLVYKNADWEFLSEAYAIRHGTKGAKDVWTTAGFVQIGKKFNKITPYARFTYLNAPNTDQIFAIIGQDGRHYGPSVGVRYDFSTFLALKAQYDYVVNSGPGIDLGPTFNPISAGSYSQVSLQAAFTY